MAEKISGGGAGRQLNELESEVRNFMKSLEPMVGKKNDITFKFKIDGAKDLEKAVEQCNKLKDIQESKINFGSLSEFSTLLRDMKDNGLDMSQFKNEIKSVKDSIKDVKLPRDVIMNEGSTTKRMRDLIEEMSPIYESMINKDGSFNQMKKLFSRDARKFTSDYAEYEYLQTKITKLAESDKYTRKFLEDFSVLDKFINENSKHGLNPLRDEEQEFKFNYNTLRQQSRQAVNKRLRSTFIDPLYDDISSYIPTTTRSKNSKPTQPTPPVALSTGSEAPAQQFKETGQAAEEAASKVQKFINQYNEALNVGDNGKAQGNFRRMFDYYIDAIKEGNTDDIQRVLDVFPQLEKFKSLDISKTGQRSFSRSLKFIEGESIHDLMETIPELQGYLTDIDYNFEKTTMSAKEFFETKGLPGRQEFRTDALSLLGDKYKQMISLPSEDLDFAFLQDAVSQMDYITEDKWTVVESMFKKIRSLRSDLDNEVGDVGFSDIRSQISDVANILSPNYVVSPEELQTAKEYLGIKEKINQENTESTAPPENSGLLAQEKTLQSVLETVKLLNEAMTQLQSIFSSVTPESYSQQFESFRATLEGLSTALPNLTGLLDGSNGINIKDINIEQIATTLGKIQESAQAFNGESIQGLSQFFTQLSESSQSIDNVTKLASAIGQLGTSIEEIGKSQGFNETLSPINDLLKNAEQLKSLASVLSTSSSKIKDAEKLVNPQYGSEDYINDIKNYYKYFERAMLGGNDKDAEALLKEYEARTSAYEERINQKKQQGLQLTNEELKAMSAKADAEKKQLDNIQKAETAQKNKADQEKKAQESKAKQEQEAQAAKAKQDEKAQAAKQKQDQDEYAKNIKNYYKYLEQAKKQELNGETDQKSQVLADQYHQKTLQYAEQINEKRRQGVELTDDELKAFETRTNAQKKYLENVDKVRARQKEIQESQKEKAINEYMKNTGTDTAVRSAQNLIKQNIDNEDTAIQGQVTKLRDLINSLEKEVGELNTKFEGATIPDSATVGVDKLRRDIKAASQELREMVSGQNIKMADENLVSRLQANIANWVNANPKALKAYGDEIKNIQNTLSGDNLELDQFKAASKQFDEIKVKANEANNVGKTFSDTLKGSFGNLARYLMTFASFYQVINVFKQAVGVVKELDSALTEMRKVSDESISSLKQYQLDTFNMADKVGTTAQQIQNSTADWLRLGKSFKDAQELAMQSTVLLNVSEFTDIQQATDQLVSATQAYDELDASAITDKLNIIGNNFAVGTSDLASGLQNAAAVLKTQGNDIDQAVALLTTGNLIGQDMSKQSAGIRTISLRIAGTKEQKQEIQDMGEDVDDFVVRTQSKTDQIIRNYTAVQSNAYKGVSVLDENGNLRSTYDINYCVHIQETYMLN